MQTKSRSRSKSLHLTDNMSRVVVEISRKTLVGCEDEVMKTMRNICTETEFFCLIKFIENIFSSDEHFQKIGGNIWKVCKHSLSTRHFLEFSFSSHVIDQHTWRMGAMISRCVFHPAVMQILCLLNDFKPKHYSHKNFQILLISTDKEKKYTRNEILWFLIILFIEASSTVMRKELIFDEKLWRWILQSTLNERKMNIDWFTILFFGEF